MGSFLKVGFFIMILVVSFYLAASQDVKLLADQTLVIKLVAAFIAGIFYTSFFTAALSILILIALGVNTNIYLITIVAGMGAILGDLIIVKFFRLLFHGISAITPHNFFKGLKKMLKAYHLDILSWILGSVIVASPFPDELGLILLGASKLSYFQLAVLTFTLNSLGILIILAVSAAII